MYEILISPFVEYDFLYRALLTGVFISISSAPLGVFLILRRVSLMGDAISHGILPGIAISYIIYGLSIWALTFGGIAAGIIIAGASYLISNKTILKEDATLTGIYLFSLAIGVFILSASNGQMCVMHFLFGDILGVGRDAFNLIIVLSAITPIILSLILKPLIYGSFDPLFCKSNKIPLKRIQVIFLSLVVVNLVVGCQAMGTIMTLGIMMIPAIAARIICIKVIPMLMVSSIIGIISSVFGVLISYHFNFATSPAIVMTSGIIWIFSMIYNYSFSK